MVIIKFRPRGAVSRQLCGCNRRCSEPMLLLRKEPATGRCC